MLIHIPAHRLRHLINRLDNEERRACGLDTRATDLRHKLERIRANLPEDCSISLTHEELEGILL